MPVTVEAIMSRLKDLNIKAFVQDGELILRAVPGSISERCKQVVRENKAAIIDHLTKGQPQSFEEQVVSVFPRGCQIIMQSSGYTLAQRVEDIKAERRKVTQAQRETWTKEAWAEAEAVQFTRIEQYRKKWRSGGRPVPESAMGKDGYFVVDTPFEREFF